ncbi:MAG: RuvX/YqgF family protein, partial [Planctomycetota bacterium]
NEATGLPVRLFDERFSTAVAKERLGSAGVRRRRKKQQLDAVAALVVLESFLEACHYRGEIVGQTIHQTTVGDQPLDGESGPSEPRE